MALFVERINTGPTIKFAPELEKAFNCARRSIFLAIPSVNLSKPAGRDVMGIHGLVYDGMTHDTDAADIIHGALTALHKYPSFVRAVRSDERLREYVFNLRACIDSDITSCDPTRVRIMTTYEVQRFGSRPGKQTNEIYRPVLGITYPKGIDRFIVRELETVVRAAGCLPYETKQVSSHIAAPI